MNGFKQIYFGKREPVNKEVLWLKPSASHYSVTLLYYWNDGWTVVNSDFILNRVRLDRLVKFVTYDPKCSTLRFYDYDQMRLFDVPLDNLNDLVGSAATSVVFNNDTKTLEFYNGSGKIVYSVSVADFMTAGDGIAIEGGVVSIVIDPDSESYLELTENGLKITGIDALKERVDTAEENISSMQEKLDTSGSEIDALEERMDTAEADIDSLEGRMTTAETDIDNLETTVNTKVAGSMEYSERYKTISLLALDGTTLSTVDTTPFEKDGMIDAITLEIDPLDYKGTYMHFAYNEDAGKDDIYLNLTGFLVLSGSDSIDLSSDRVISLNETYLASLMPDIVAYENDQETGMIIGHLLVNNESTDVTVQYASTTRYGVVQVGDGLGVSDGLVSVDDDYINNLIAKNENVVALQDVTASSLASSITYDSETKKIYLYALDGTLLATIDATDFIKDGMLNKVGLVDADAEGNEGKYIYLAWNTDAGIDDMYVDVSDLVDVYTAGDGLALDGYEFSVDVSYIQGIIAGNVVVDSAFDSGISVAEVTVNGAATSIYVPYATSSQAGLVKLGDGLSGEADGAISVEEDYIQGIIGDTVSVTRNASSGYEVFVITINGAQTEIYTPYASESQYGVVQVGDGLAVSGGVISVDDDYIANLISEVEITVNNIMKSGLALCSIICNGITSTIYAPIATADSLGVMMAGDSISIASSGEIDVNEDWLDDYLDSYITASASYSSGTKIGSVTIGDSTTSYYVPTATTSQLGLMKVGNGLDVSSGTVSVDASDVVSVSRSYSSGLSLGSITIDSTATTFYVPYATTSQKGVVSISSGGGLSVSSGTLSIDDSYIISLIEANTSSGGDSSSGDSGGDSSSGSSDYTLPVATSSTLGGVMIGDGINVTSAGVISVDEDYITSLVGGSSSGGDSSSGSSDYTLPVATSSTLGGVKIGDGIDVTSAGVISVDDDYIIALIEANTSGSGDSSDCYWYKSGTNIYAGTSTTASYAAYATAFYESSDERLKENIAEVSAEDMEKVSKVGVKRFNFKEGDTRTRFGVIAQELEGAGLGSIVSTSEDGYKSVDYTAFLALKITQLEKENATIKDKNTELENRLRKIEKILNMN